MPGSVTFRKPCSIEIGFTILDGHQRAHAAGLSAPASGQGGGEDAERIRACRA